jgi:hypothetical protein
MAYIRINTAYDQLEISLGAMRDPEVIRACFVNDRISSKGNKIGGFRNVDHGAIVPDPSDEIKDTIRVP